MCEKLLLSNTFDSVLRRYPISTTFRFMQIPPNTPTFESDIATYWFEDGLLVAQSKSVKRTVELIKANMEIVKAHTNNTPVPLLIFLVDSPVPDKATRAFSSKAVAEIYSAMAMVSKPGLSSLIMNLVFRFSKPPIPMQTFDQANVAKAWLKQLK